MTLRRGAPRRSAATGPMPAASRRGAARTLVPWAISALLAPPAAALAADSATTAPRGAVPIQRILAEADSVLRRQGGPRGESAQLFLSWSAPWGAKRAQRSRVPACADSTVEDTLYLSFLPGRRAERFTGFTAQVFLRATGADTLGTWWHLEGKGGENAGSLRAEWSAAPGFGWRQPFPVMGQGFALLDRTPRAVRLRLIYAVPLDQAGPVAPDSLYALGRVIFRHRPERRLAGCGQPVCVEWASGTLAFGPKDEPQVSRGERFVGYGGPYALCEPFKGPHLRPWKPRATPARPAAAPDSARATPR